MLGQDQSLAKKRVLLVDDEPGIRATLPLILRKYGFDVAVAATLEEAFDKIQSQHFDLLLSDLNIDRVGDGFRVVRAMRDANPQCVAIILTGYPCFETAIEGIHHALDDYLVKPTNTDALITTMREHLMAKQPANNLPI